jgi:hypothetical protein
MLNEIVRKVELVKAGLVDRTDDAQTRPLIPAASPLHTRPTDIMPRLA